MCGFYIFPISIMNNAKEVNKPVQVFRIHGVSAKVFENRTESGLLYYKVHIERTYKDGKDWKTTASFNVDDMPLIIYVASKASRYVERLSEQQSAAEVMNIPVDEQVNTVPRATKSRVAQDAVENAQ